MNSMLYTQPATSLTPALIIYLIDASHSMNDLCGPMTKIDLVNRALRDVIKDMVRRSMRDGVVQRRYKVAILAYSSEVVDVLGGIRDLPDLVREGTPILSAGGETDTTAGFAAVETLLQENIARFQSYPAPLVCHLTDALFTESDPSSLIKRIQTMTVNDGPVLIENVYVADKMLRASVSDWHTWGA
ncbi:hypothetical protein KDW_36400 [Dictyobacter vulcani]|uniref:VWFA domain-containing protein n=1 Tax=Dictyobacter vulcani TaxID=2607529 RepID=A0A5J4KI77_9CHLR|nr:vWA domain-containing protein [Dictyobacter vulcani]GER89478.1 hypothetical protein KDW_36400 [Dictyobacter vulcani]